MTTSPEPRPSLRAAALSGLIFIALFLVAALPLILSDPSGGRADWDERTFHVPSIEKFSREWPAFDFSDYPSAMTPGYHLALAFVHRFVSSDITTLRLFGSLFTVGLVGTLGAALGARLGVRPALPLCLPLVASLYVYSAGVWLLPDNAAWWGVAVMLLLGFRGRVDWLTYVAGAIALAALVFTRQVHAWTAGVLIVAAWLGNRPANVHVPPRIGGRGWKRDVLIVLGVGDPREWALHRRLGRAALALLACVPAALIVAYFLRTWGGLIVPMYQPQNAGAPNWIRLTGGNAATPALILSLIAIISFFFCGFLLPRLGELWSAPRFTNRLIALSGLVGFLAGIIPRTSYDEHAGRWSGLWRIVRKLPTFADRSPLIVAGSTAGAVFAALWFFSLDRRDRWIFLVATLGFIAAQSASHQSWQRYYEPFVLTLIGLAAARVRATDRSLPGWTAYGCLILAALMAVVTYSAVR